MKHLLAPLLITVCFYCCKTPQQSAVNKDDGKISFSIVQVNDVYEIAPLTGGKYGGMARVASIRKQQQQQEPNTFLLMAGDFLSPSVFNSLKYNNKRIRGAQMVDAMNAAGVDLAIFGNHEFDIAQTELQERLDESAFNWVASNVWHRKDSVSIPFTAHGKPIPETFIISIRDKDGTTARIGFFGITIPTTTASYTSYKHPLEISKQVYERLKDSCDAVIAVTHQNVADDIELAKVIPSLPLIVGGHEHDMRFEKVGNVFITKAHANARSAFIIDLKIDKNTQSVTVSEPQLKMIDSTVPFEPVTDEAVKKWTKRANDNYNSLGFDPAKIVLSSGDSLEGREIYTRDTVSNLTTIIVEAMQQACPEAAIVLYNAGSIRLDDVLTPPVSQYDILRTLPFGGSIVEVDMRGALLNQILASGLLNKGTGGFIHHSAAPEVDTAKTYRVALSDFLLTGGETGMAYLKRDNALITKIYPENLPASDPRTDIRLAIIRYLETRR